MARVTKPGGRVIIVDSRAPEDPALDREFNQIEKLRDPSHVRNYRPSEWRTMVTAAGLRITFEELDFYTENGRPDGFRGMDRAGEHASGGGRRTDPPVSPTRRPH